jgi:hypothetical protein
MDTIVQLYVLCVWLWCVEVVIDNTLATFFKPIKCSDEVTIRTQLCYWKYATPISLMDHYLILF